MSLEQSVDRLSGLIEQLIKQLEAGRSAGAAPAPQANKAKPAPQAEAKSAPQAETKAPQAEAEAKPALDYEKDIKVKFQFLAANDRPKAVAILKSYQDKAGREGKLVEVLDPADYQEAYDRIEAALVSLRPPGA